MFTVRIREVETHTKVSNERKDNKSSLLQVFVCPFLSYEFAWGFFSQVGERLTSLPCPSSTRPVDTDHVTLSWEGLEKVSQILPSLSHKRGAEDLSCHWLHQFWRNE
jgi:hypothetical protein